MREFDRGVYPGSSKDEEPDLEPALKYAILNAYKKGINAKPSEGRFGRDGEPIPYRFKVEAIFVEGTNPPTDYKVYLVDH